MLSPTPGLGDDLRTDWIPDALGGFGVAAGEGPPPDEARVTVAVAVRGGRRAVPVSSIEFRAWADAVVEATAPALEVRLSAAVHGYRDHATPYRAEWMRFTDACRLLAHSAEVVVKVDVADFFGSVDEDHAGWLPGPLRGVLTESRRRYGVALLPGHRWARRVANVVLEPADRALDTAFVRWQDDYFIAARRGRENEAVAPLIERLAQLGLRLNDAKRAINPVLPSAPEPDQDPWRHGSLPALMAGAIRDGSLAAAKRTLRAGVERRDPSLLPAVPGIAELMPAAIPRLAMYLDSAASHPGAAAVLIEVIDTDDAWATSRWLAVAARHDHLAQQVSTDVIDRFAEHPIPALRGLVARVQRLRGEARTAATSRIDRLLRDLSATDLDQAAPVVDTTL